eukprot:g52452.t1
MPPDKTKRTEITLRVQLNPTEPLALNGSFVPEAKLWEVLKRLEIQHGVDLTERAGLPPEEDHKYFTVTYNVPGRLLPVVHYRNRKVETEAMLRRVSLRDLGISSSSPVELLLTFKYEAPPIDPEERARVLHKFRTLLKERTEQTMRAEASGESLVQRDSPQSQPLAATLQEQHTQQDAPVQQQDVQPQSLRLWVAASSFDPRKFTWEDESYYDITLNDSVAYARDLRAQVGRIRRHTKDTPPLRKQAKLRFRCPYHLWMETTFSSSSTVGDVKEYLKTVLVEALEYSLVVTPPRQVLSDPSQTLASLGLVPKAVVHISLPESIVAQWEDEWTTTPGRGMIQEPFLDSVERINPAALVEQADQAASTEDSSDQPLRNDTKENPQQDDSEEQQQQPLKTQQDDSEEQQQQPLKKKKKKKKQKPAERIAGEGEGKKKGKKKKKKGSQKEKQGLTVTGAEV